MKKTIENIFKKINALARKIGRPVQLMEVCGTHTQTIARHGIRQKLPKNIKLITGPGCPVCITPQEEIDAVVSLALNGIPIATYGDVFKVPGTKGSLEQAGSQGAEIKVVYSVEEALKYKTVLPDLVFFGIGFETTAPMTAIAIKKGLTVYSAHRLFIPAMRELSKINGLKIDGFISPGHVATITGSKALNGINAPQVIAGFEPEDVAIAIYLLLKQILEERTELENEYNRSVTLLGNQKAQKILSEVFHPKDANWRGFGIIKKSGLAIKPKFKDFDAKIKFRKLLDKHSNATIFRTACLCSSVVLGIKQPMECKMFKTICRPENPFGPCMVSSEGACHIKYEYE